MVSAAESACGEGRLSVAASACGQGLRTGAHLRCFPSRSRSHGRLRRPKSLPIRHSPAAAQCRPPLGCRDCHCFDLFAASIRKSGLEIENRCMDCPCFDLMAASIRKSGLEIKNRCTDCPCFDLLAASIRKSRPKIKNRCTDCPYYDLMAASIRKSGLEIENRCSAIVPASRMARLQYSRGAQAGKGCDEGGIILSKKPPEWRLPLPQQRSASNSNFLCRK